MSGELGLVLAPEQSGDLGGETAKGEVGSVDLVPDALHLAGAWRIGGLQLRLHGEPSGLAQESPPDGEQR